MLKKTASRHTAPTAPNADDLATAKEYRLLAGSHGRPEGDKNVRYSRGSRIVLTASEVAKFAPGRLELIGPATTPHPGLTSKPAVGIASRVTVKPTAEDKRAARATNPPKTEYDWSEVLAASAKEIVDYIGTLEEAEELTSLIEQESASDKPRKSVLAAAEERLAAIDSEEE